MTYVRYIDKTREYYRQGYEKPYQWAHFDNVASRSLNPGRPAGCSGFNR